MIITITDAYVALYAKQASKRVTDCNETPNELTGHLCDILLLPFDPFPPDDRSEIAKQTELREPVSLRCIRGGRATGMRQILVSYVRNVPFLFNILTA